MADGTVRGRKELHTPYVGDLTLSKFPEPLQFSELGVLYVIKGPIPAIPILIQFFLAGIL